MEEMAEATFKNFSAQASLVLPELEEDDKNAVDSENLAKMPSSSRLAT